MEAARQLLARGFHVGAIRPPTVPAGTCRLRVSLSAAHSVADVDALADAIIATGALRYGGVVNSGGGGGGGALPHLLLPAPWTEAWLRRQDELDEAEGLAGGAAVGGAAAALPARPAPQLAPRPRL